MSERSAILIVVSGPTGTGKTTLCRRLVQERSQVDYSISLTTRAPRPNEVNGKDYHFVSVQEFERWVAADEMLEYAQVHQTNYYGTSRPAVLAKLQAGMDVVMDLDVQGAQQLRTCGDEQVRAALVDIFILPPGWDELRRRVSARGPMDDAEWQRRMASAQAELNHWEKYQYAIVSSEPEADFRAFCAVIDAEHQRVGRVMFPQSPEA